MEPGLPLQRRQVEYGRPQRSALSPSLSGDRCGGDPVTRSVKVSLRPEALHMACEGWHPPPGISAPTHSVLPPPLPPLTLAAATSWLAARDTASDKTRCAVGCVRVTQHGGGGGPQ